MASVWMPMNSIPERLLASQTASPVLPILVVRRTSSHTRDITRTSTSDGGGKAWRYIGTTVMRSSVPIMPCTLFPPLSSARRTLTTHSHTCHTAGATNDSSSTDLNQHPSPTDPNQQDSEAHTQEYVGVDDPPCHSSEVQQDALLVDQSADPVKPVVNNSSGGSDSGSDSSGGGSGGMPTSFSVHPTTGWTSRQQLSVMVEGRDWQAVRRFWQGVLSGHVCLSDMQPPVTPATHLMSDMQICTHLDIPSTVQGPNSQHVTLDKPLDLPLDHGTAPDHVQTAQSHTQSAQSHTQTVSYHEPDAHSSSPSIHPHPSHSHTHSHTHSHDTSTGTHLHTTSASIPSTDALLTSGNSDGNTVQSDQLVELVESGKLAASSQLVEPITLPAALRRRQKRAQNERITYKVALAYYGPSFDGWAKQVGNPKVGLTVEAALCDALQPLMMVTGQKAGVAGAGRTDKGVSAVGQVFSFYSWVHPPLTQQALAHAIYNAPNTPPGSLRLVASTTKPRSFHAQFSATWRRYVYLLPLYSSTCPPQHSEDQPTLNAQPSATSSCGQNGHPDPLQDVQQTAHVHDPDTTDENDTSASASALSHKPVFRGGVIDVDPDVVHRLLQPLVGRSLDFCAYARDTPKGKETTCHLQLARATRVRLPPTHSYGINGSGAPLGLAVEGTKGAEALCIELVADRFLRKMVRVLVSTVVMEALAIQGAAHTHTLSSSVADWDVMVSRCGDKASRLHTCVPAPAEGLCFAGVGYDSIAWEGTAGQE